MFTTPDTLSDTFLTTDTAEDLEDPLEVDDVPRRLTSEVGWASVSECFAAQDPGGRAEVPRQDTGRLGGRPIGIFASEFGQTHSR